LVHLELLPFLERIHHHHRHYLNCFEHTRERWKAFVLALVPVVFVALMLVELARAELLLQGQLFCVARMADLLPFLSLGETYPEGAALDLGA
jgi:hypothetical protein